MLGYAVIDCETTGLNKTGSDRIAEIAVATFDKDFNPTGQYQTLINPEQDLGLTSLHGIDGLMASNAPRFVEVMNFLASLLHDRIIIGHNVDFDLKFIAHEFKKQNIELLWKGSYLDTLQMAKEANLTVENNQLSTLCAYFGIELFEAHSAMADVIATAKLFRVLLKTQSSVISGTPSPLHFPASDITLSSDESKWISRKTIQEKINTPHDWDGFLYQLPTSGKELSPTSIHSYLNALHISLINSRFTYRESEAMREMAESLSLSQSQVTDLNERYFFALLCENLTTSRTVLHSDFSSMKTAMEFTGTEERRVQELLEETLDSQESISVGFQLFQSLFSLKAGDGVVITGEEFSKSKQHLKTMLQTAGFRVLPSTTKSGTKALIANDPYSLSNKATTARRFGVPILTEATVERLIKHF